VKSRFSGGRIRGVRIGAVLEQEFAELPVAMEGGRIEPEILAKRLEPFSMRDQETDGADIAEIGARGDQAHAVGIAKRGWLARRQEIEHQIRPAVHDAVKHGILTPGYIHITSFSVTA
jgi:hypothetical protein